MDLTRIRDGTFPKQADTPDIYQPGAAWHFSPAIAFAPDADILYAVHGDENKLTSIDFAKHSVSTVGVHTKTSWLDRLLALTAGVAHAKGMDGTTKQGFISADGKYIYVIGSTETVTKQARGTSWDMSVTPLGLQAIAVRDGTLEQKIDTEAYDARPSPDGKYIYLTGWKQDSSTSAPWTEIYDVSSRSIVRHLDGVQLVPTRRMDGAATLQSNVMISDNVCDMASVNPGTWSVVSRWKAPVCADWLMLP